MEIKMSDGGTWDACSDWYADGQTMATFVNGQSKD
jgi:hypothetical protein